MVRLWLTLACSKERLQVSYARILFLGYTGISEMLVNELQTVLSTNLASLIKTDRRPSGQTHSLYI